LLGGVRKRSFAPSSHPNQATSSPTATLCTHEILGILVVGLEGAKLRFQPPTTKSPVLTIVIYQVVARKGEGAGPAGLPLPSYYLINYIG